MILSSGILYKKYDVIQIWYNITKYIISLLTVNSFWILYFLINTKKLNMKFPHQIEIKIPLAPTLGVIKIDKVIVIRFLTRVLKKIYFSNSFLIRICWLPVKGKLNMIIENIRRRKL